MTIGIFEAEQKLSELVERASQGEEIVITCRGKERARLVGVAVKSRRSVKEIFDSFSRVGMKLPKGMQAASSSACSGPPDRVRAGHFLKKFLV